MMASRIKLGYWKCRGLGHPIKLMLEYLDLPYDIIEAKCGPAPYFDKKEWLAKKHELLPDYDFPNLPYFDDGNAKLTQTFAIMQYLGRRYKLFPEEEQEMMNVDLIREQTVDLLELLVKYMYFFEHRAQGKEVTMDEIHAKHAIVYPLIKTNINDLGRKFSRTIADNSSTDVIWQGGKKLTYLDFMVFEQLDYARNLFPGILDSPQSKSLQRFMEQFEKLPRIAAYLSSDRFSKFPFYGERSYLGRSPETCYLEELKSEN